MSEEEDKKFLEYLDNVVSYYNCEKTNKRIKSCQEKNNEKECVCLLNETNNIINTINEKSAQYWTRGKDFIVSLHKELESVNGDETKSLCRKKFGEKQKESRIVKNKMKNAHDKVRDIREELCVIERTIKSNLNFNFELKEKCLQVLSGLQDLGHYSCIVLTPEGNNDEIHLVWRDKKTLCIKVFVFVFSVRCTYSTHEFVILEVKEIYLILFYFILFDLI